MVSRPFGPGFFFSPSSSLPASSSSLPPCWILGIHNIDHDIHAYLSGNGRRFPAAEIMTEDRDDQGLIRQERHHEALRSYAERIHGYDRPGPRRRGGRSVDKARIATKIVGKNFYCGAVSIMEKLLLWRCFDHGVICVLIGGVFKRKRNLDQETTRPHSLGRSLVTRTGSSLADIVHDTVG